MNFNELNVNELNQKQLIFIVKINQQINFFVFSFRENVLHICIVKGKKRVTFKKMNVEIENQIKRMNRGYLNNRLHNLNLKPKDFS